MILLKLSFLNVKTLETPTLIANTESTDFKTGTTISNKETTNLEKNPSTENTESTNLETVTTISNQESTADLEIITSTNNSQTKIENTESSLEINLSSTFATVESTTVMLRNLSFLISIKVNATFIPAFNSLSSTESKKLESQFINIVSNNISLFFF